MKFDLIIKVTNKKIKEEKTLIITGSDKSWLYNHGKIILMKQPFQEMMEVISFKVQPHEEQK